MVERGKNFIWLMYWFWSQCNGDWEHEYGIVLDTTSEGKWKLDISISNSILDGVEFISNDFIANAGNEVECKFDNQSLVVYADTQNIIRVLQSFRAWAEPYTHIDSAVHRLKIDDAHFLWLLDWYENEYSKKIRIHFGTYDNPGWSFWVDLNNSGFERFHFDEISIQRTENDWLFCNKKKTIFELACGPFNLVEGLGLFFQFIEDSQQRMRAVS